MKKLLNLSLAAALLAASAQNIYSQEAVAERLLNLSKLLESKSIRLNPIFDRLPLLSN